MDFVKDTLLVLYETDWSCERLTEVISADVSDVQIGALLEIVEATVLPRLILLESGPLDKLVLLVAHGKIFGIGGEEPSSGADPEIVREAIEDIVFSRAEIIVKHYPVPHTFVEGRVGTAADALREMMAAPQADTDLANKEAAYHG